MSQDNIFKEIEEDLERQRYQDLWNRYGSFILAAALLIVLGTGAYNFWQSHTAENNQKATGALASIVAQSKTDQGKEIEALQNFAQQNQGKTQATFALLAAAADTAKQGNKDQAVKLYDAIASDATANHALRQLADLFSVEMQMDSGDAMKLEKRLAPLTLAPEPWHYSAKEITGYLALRNGEKEKARSIFTDLSQDAGVPQTMSARAVDVLRLLSE